MNRKIFGINSRNGFTLAELLIVVAIIAVLVATAVPVFGNQTERARESTDLANIRAAYAEVMNEVILDGNQDATRQIDLVQQRNGWTTATAQAALEGLGKVVGVPQAGGSCTVSFDKDTNRAVITFGEGSDSRIVFPSDIDGYTNAYARLIGQYANAGNILNDSNQSLNSQIGGWADDYNGHKITVVPLADSKYSVRKQMQSDDYDDSVINRLGEAQYWTYLEDIGNGQYKPIGYAYQINVKTGPYEAHNEVHIKDMSNNEVQTFIGNYSGADTSVYMYNLLKEVYKDQS